LAPLSSRSVLCAYHDGALATNHALRVKEADVSAAANCGKLGGARTFRAAHHTPTNTILRSRTALSSKPELAAELIKLGARYVSTGTDLSFLLSAAMAKAKQMLSL
jgi:2-keto-3-deoxy-L-rhamnonate aldolase RhmA